MKYKTTKKETQSNYRNIIKIGYADLQFLLKFTEPTAYTCGVYGWNADVYDFDNVAIVTGYRPFGNIPADYDLCEEYEEKAQKLINSRPSRIDTELKKLINLFIIDVQVKNNKKEG